MQNILQYLLFLSALLPHTSIFCCMDNGSIFPPPLIVRIPLSGYVNFTWRVCVYKSKIKILPSQQTSCHPHETRSQCHWWAVLEHLGYPIASKGAIQLELKPFWYLQIWYLQNLQVWRGRPCGPNPRRSKSSQETHDKLNMQRLAWEHTKIRGGSNPYQANSPTVPD